MSDTKNKRASNPYLDNQGSEAVESKDAKSLKEDKAIETEASAAIEPSTQLNDVPADIPSEEMAEQIESSKALSEGSLEKEPKIEEKNALDDNIKITNQCQPNDAKPQIQVLIGASCEDKAGKCTPGEDAYTIVVFPDGRVLIAVADGVSCWQDDGIDPKAFSKGIIREVAKVAADKNIKTSDILFPAFQQLVKNNQSGEESTPESSTVCLGIIKNNWQLEVCNLGDSALWVIRDGKTVLCTKPQETSCNCPEQMTIDPIHKTVTDRSSYAANYNFTLKSGDIIIMATDGLFDNVYPHTIVEKTHNGTAFDIASKLVTEARKNMKSHRATPYSDELRLRRSEGHEEGGKLDDVTVIVCEVASVN